MFGHDRNGRKEMGKSSRAMEIDQLVYFIRNADLDSARRSLVNFLERGEPVSKEIVTAYQHLERGFAVVCD
jgi:hypothetical protein